MTRTNARSAIGARKNIEGSSTGGGGMRDGTDKSRGFGARIASGSFLWMRLVLGLLLVVVMSGAECYKAAEFFAPVTLVDGGDDGAGGGDDGGDGNGGGNGGGDLVDTSPPVFSSPQPAGGTVVNTDNFMLVIDDPLLSDGSPGSGVDESSISSTVNGSPVPIVVDGMMIAADVNGVSDGPYNWMVLGADLNGNMSSFSSSGDKDTQPPVLNFVDLLPSTLDVVDPTFEVTWGVMATDPHFAAGNYGVFDPGSDGICGTSDDTPWPQGTGPGEVDVQSAPLTGMGTITQTFNNPLTDPADSPVTRLYCWNGHAEDSAVSKTGIPAPNSIFTSGGHSDVTWNPPPPVAPFVVMTDTWYEHFGGFSRYCYGIVTVPPQPGAAVHSVTTGPGVFPGNSVQDWFLGATGTGFVGHNISLPGRYNSDITVTATNGDQVMVQAGVDVTAAAGAQACP